MNTDKYVKKWLEGTLTGEERAKFEQTESFKKIKKISESVQYFKAPEYDIEAELERINQNKSGKGKVVELNWQKILLRVAAMLTIIVGGYIYYLYFLNITVETTMAEKKSIILPDSSEIMLNAVSKISYNTIRWKNNRKIELEGEAFFKVRKGSKFDVETIAGNINVLGTQFNVKQRNGYFEVVCYEGLVQVKAEGDNNQLPASHTIRFVNGKVIKDIVSDEAAPSWINNESSFKSVPFKEVIREFERQYKVSVIAKDINMEKLFTGRFSHNDMILALKSITIPQNISYQITANDKIIFSTEIE